MHYYKRNIGDYAKKAGRLSMLEHGAYTLLIDACYDREQFPTLEEALDWAWARTEAEESAVKFVLSKFFTLIDGVYVQNRIKEELAEYKEKAETNTRIAKEREANRKKNKQAVNEPLRTVNESCEKTHEPSPNQEPLTNNQLNNNNAREEKTESNLYVSPSRRLFQITQDWKPEPNTWAETLKVSQHLVKPEQFTDYTLAEFIRANLGKEEKTEHDWQRFYVNALARGYIKPMAENTGTKKPNPHIYQPEASSLLDLERIVTPPRRKLTPEEKAEIDKGMAELLAGVKNV